MRNFLSGLGWGLVSIPAFSSAMAISTIFGIILFWAYWILFALDLTGKLPARWSLAGRPRSGFAFMIRGIGLATGFMLAWIAYAGWLAVHSG